MTWRHAVPRTHARTAPCPYTYAYADACTYPDANSYPWPYSPSTYSPYTYWPYTYSHYTYSPYTYSP